MHGGAARGLAARNHPDQKEQRAAPAARNHPD
jgi:hypothetical protein